MARTAGRIGQKQVTVLIHALILIILRRIQMSDFEKLSEEQILEKIADRNVYNILAEIIYQIQSINVQIQEIKDILSKVQEGK
jgi:predicted transcriptional regulator